MGQTMSTWDFRSMFLDALRTALKVPSFDTSFLSSFDAAVAARTATAPPNIRPQHVESTALFAAAHDVLTAKGNADPLTVLGEVIDAYGKEISDYTRKSLDASADPFNTIVGESKLRERDYFGSDFKFERPVGTQDAYHLHVTDCAYARIFSAWQLPHLTGLFCRLDEAWIRAIDPGRHGVRFTRPETIGWGGARCRFLFDRIK
jgi:hypothetical protein